MIGISAGCGARSAYSDNAVTKSSTLMPAPPHPLHAAALLTSNRDIAGTPARTVFRDIAPR